MGARIGLEAITRLHPGDSHLPDKTDQVQAAAWSAAATDWPSAPPAPRPLSLFRPEPLLGTGDSPDLPARFRWRRQTLAVIAAAGPERIAPEWWLDLPEWRTGQRDYWRVDTDSGQRLWLYFAHGDAMSAGWFCHGSFG
jgi:protein ImuB